jgi:hypothetical protein
VLALDLGSHVYDFGTFPRLEKVMDGLFEGEEAVLDVLGDERPLGAPLPPDATHSHSSGHSKDSK